MAEKSLQERQKLEQMQREWEEDEKKSIRLLKFAYLFGLFGGLFTLLLIYLVYYAMKAGAQ